MRLADLIDKLIEIHNEVEGNPIVRLSAEVSVNHHSVDVENGIMKVDSRDEWGDIVITGMIQY